MKAKYIILVSLVVVFISTILLTREKSISNTSFEPGIALGASSELLNSDEAIKGMEDELRNNPDKQEIKLNLAYAYLQAGRITGNHNYYDALAFKMVNEVLKSDVKNFQAMSAKAILQASAHQFKDALETSQDAIKINPHNSYIYGVQCDAYVELGKYNEAIKTADKMMSLRPDVGSYSRISYLREIIGDYPGAIEAMKKAQSAGAVGLEQTEWCRVYLGRLYEITGRTNEAELCYQRALINRINYAPALAGLARIEKMRKNYVAAIKLYTTAIEAMQDYSFHHELALLYQLTNEPEKAQNEFQTALDFLIKHQHPTSEENGIGHHVDRELSLVYTSMHQYDEALSCAKYEHERRPDNIDVNETLAWANYHVKNYTAAQHYILKSLKTKSMNAELWYKAGLIFKANKNIDLGNKYLAIALRTNPKLDTMIYEMNYPSKNIAAR